jgi:hypothetical protein
MRRSLLQKVLPLPFVEEWRIRADDCLIFGSSLAGARKRILAQPLVRYRVHGTNQYCGRKLDTGAVFRRRLAMNRLFEHFERTLCFNADRLAEDSHCEFRTIEKPSVADLFTYAKITMGARIRLSRRLGFILEMLLHLLRTNRQAADTGGIATWQGAPHANILPLRPPEPRSQSINQKAVEVTRQERRAA